MVPYLLVLFGMATRYLLAGHVAWLNFTAVTGSLVYFGARRSWREMLAPLALLMASDFCLTTYVYHYAFHWQYYVIDWVWYAAAMFLGAILLGSRTTFVRGAARIRWPDWRRATSRRFRSTATTCWQRQLCWEWRSAQRHWCGG